MKSCGKLLAVVTVLFWINQAIAQPPRGMPGPQSQGDDRYRPGDRGPGGGDHGSFRGRGGPRGDYRSHRPPPSAAGEKGRPGGDSYARGVPPVAGHRGPGGPPPASPTDGGHAAKLEGFLRSLDANKNGIIEPGEVPEERKRILGYIAQRTGIDINGPIDINKFRDAMARRSSPTGSAGPKKSSNKTQPLVPGFGTDTESARVPGFGERVEVSAASTSSSRSPSSRSSSSRSRSSSSKGKQQPPSSRSPEDQERENRIRGFAKSMIKRYDTDKSGVVEKHEWGKIRGDPNEMDLDHNGKITEDEMTKRLMNYSKRRSGGDRSESSRDGRSDSSRSSGSDDAERPRSYRFTTAQELLPENLPPWFAELDGSGDGQVSMAEFSSSWDAKKANEFVRLDLNNDGLITARECLDADSATEPPDTPTGPLVGRSYPPKASGGRPSPSKSPAKPKPSGSSEKPWWET